MRTKINIEVKHIVEDTYIYIGSVDGKVIFRNTFEDTTEGITEFVGAVHGLMYIRKQNLYGDVVVSNKYIKDCIEAQKYEHRAKGEKANAFLGRCRRWLLDQRSGINVELITPVDEIKDVSEDFKKRKTWFND